eukprot:TRINITY_DN5807_c0_g2_i1.p1 TRINITY_DN5807_c0_g2~~TRINITY_DN5807_c0_g2_i1.p1  ORF type:complete len:297 (+),score=160.56 TRINITY_DN5807_c0_g2_i1:106-996(+)
MGIDLQMDDFSMRDVQGDSTPMLNETERQTGGVMYPQSELTIEFPDAHTSILDDQSNFGGDLETIQTGYSQDAQTKKPSFLRRCFSRTVTGGILTFCLVSALVFLAMTGLLAWSFFDDNALLHQSIQYLEKDGVHEVEKYVEGLEFDDYSGVLDSPFGKVKYSFTNINIVDLNLNADNSDFDLHWSSFDFSTTGAKALMTMNWSVEQKSWPHIKDKGKGTAKASQTEVDLTFELVDTKKDIIKITKCKVNVGKLDLDIDGAAKPVYEIVSDLFEDEIKHEIGKQICKELKDYKIDF